MVTIKSDKKANEAEILAALADLVDKNDGDLEPEIASPGPGGSSIDWDAPDIARPNADGVTVLPAEWYCPEDEGLYDDLVQ